MDRQPREFVQHPLPGRRPGGRIMALLTLLMAGFYLIGTELALDGGDRLGLDWDGVRTVNSARALMGAMMPPPAADEDDESIPGLGGLFTFGPTVNPPPRETSAQREFRARMMREIGAVEGVAWAWERAMWGLVGLLAAVAVLSWITPWGRGWHLLAAFGILLMTGLTLACIRYLEIPDGGNGSIWPLSAEQHQQLTTHFKIPEGGGMPPVPTRSYVGLGAVMSAYGWLLLFIYFRPSNRLYRRPAQTDISQRDQRGADQEP